MSSAISGMCDFVENTATSAFSKGTSFSEAETLMPSGRPVSSATVLPTFSGSLSTTATTSWERSTK